MAAVIMNIVKKFEFSPEWITDKYIYLMLGIFPLWTGFKGYSAITLSKFLFFAIATGLWVIAAGAAAAVSHRKPYISKGGWCVAALLAAAFVSAVFSPYGADVWLGAGRYDGFVSLMLYGLIFIGVSSYARPKPGYAAALAFSVGICCIVSIFQLLGENPLGLFPSGLGYFDHGIKYSAQFLGNIGNVDVFGALLCLAVPLFFGIYICSVDKRAAWFLVPGVLGTFISIESGVASVKLGLAFSLIVSLIVLIKKNRLKRLCIVLLAAALAAALASYVNFTSTGVFWGKAEASQSASEAAESSAGTKEESTSYEICQMLHGHFEDSYGSGRIGIWRKLLAVYPERPVIGGGPGTVADRVEIDYSRYVEETGKTLHTVVDNAHNEYLGYLMDEGAAGFAAYLAMVVLTFVRWIKRRNKADAAVGCGMTAYWIQSFFGIGLCLVLPVIWLVWGLMWSSESGNSNSRKRGKNQNGKHAV
jgi:O-antigen ligase